MDGIGDAHMGAHSQGVLVLTLEGMSSKAPSKVLCVTSTISLVSATLHERLHPVSDSERCPPCTTSIAEARRHCYHTRKRSSQRTNNSYVSEFYLLQIGSYYLLRDRPTSNDARIGLCSVHAYPGLSHQQSPTATMRVVKNGSCCWPASMALYLH